jgi:formylglycine-generating enzyme required for sulfatase activity
MRSLAHAVLVVVAGLALSLASFGQTPTETPQATPTLTPIPSDISADGIVDARDLTILLQDWHKVSGPSNNLITVDLPNLLPGARQLRMVRIPAGTFQMGSPDTERGRYSYWEGPVHTVTITHDFYMGETEVTQAQWRAVMGSDPVDEYGVGNDRPVYYVSWNDITQTNGFLDQLDAQSSYNGFRLPTEAEWEYACRAGTSTRFYFGDSLGCGDDNHDCAAGTLPGNRSNYMWYQFNSNTPPYWSKPVRGKLPNAFGLYDMHGNVWEWCQDWWQEDFYSQPGATAPNPLCSDSTSGHRVIRGGHWFGYVWECRSAMRVRYFPAYSTNLIGVRVVLPAPP